MAASSASALAACGNGVDLPHTAPETYYRLYDAAPGKTDFWLAGVAIHEPGKRVEIVEVKALYSPNVKYLGAYLVWPRDLGPEQGGLGAGFPNPDQKVRHKLEEVVPALETTYLSAGETKPYPVRVTLGFRILSGMGGVNGIHVTYKANGKTKERYLAVGAIGCVKPKRCAGSKDPDFTEKAFRKVGLVRD